MKTASTIFLTLLLFGCTLFDKKFECEERMVLHSSVFNNLCDEALSLANCYLEKDDYQFAYYNFLEYLTGCDTNYDILVNLADCAYKLEKDSMAESLSKLAIEFDSERSMAYHNLIVIYYNQFRNDDLLRVFRQYPAKNEDSLALYMAFETYWDIDSLEKAHKCIEQALTLRPDTKTMYSRYAAFLAQIGEYDKAISICKPMFDKERTTSEMHIILADLIAFIYLDKGDTIKACEYGKYILDSEEFQEDAEKIKSYCKF